MKHFKVPVPEGYEIDQEKSSFSEIVFKPLKSKPIKTNKMNNDLKISKERVLEAASKCSTAKETLKTLFPEAFKEENKYFELSHFRKYKNTIFGLEESKRAGFKDNCFMKVICVGEYDEKAFFLSPEYNWKLVYDGLGYPYLLPTKK